MPSALLLLIHGCMARVFWPAGSHVLQFMAAIRLVCFAGALATVQLQSPPDSRQLRQDQRVSEPALSRPTCTLKAATACSRLSACWRSRVAAWP